MKYRIALLLPAFLIACATDTTGERPPALEEVNAATLLEAPAPRAGSYAPHNRDQVERGRYLVELLGCGVCHTDGALVGEPNPALLLAGSRTGIAYSSPLQTSRPGVVYPSNITPDMATGIGAWTDRQIAMAIRAGVGRHGDRRIATMPWQGYAKLSADDLTAIVSYLRSLPPIRHAVPAAVEPGRLAREDFVYFGVYRSR